MLARLRERCPGMLYNHREVRRKAVALPIGSFEDRPEGPAALDTLMAVAAACEASTLCGLVVTPPMSFGYSPMHKRWAGLSRESLTLVVAEVVTSLKKRMGAPRVVIVDGHYGHKDVVRGVAEALGAKYVNVWDVITSKGFAGFEDSLRFEEIAAKEIASNDPTILTEVIRETATLICSLARGA